MSNQKKFILSNIFSIDADLSHTYSKNSFLLLKDKARKPQNTDVKKSSTSLLTERREKVSSLAGYISAS